MRTSTAAIACLIGYASAHGLVTKITGANGVEMPGLSGKSGPSPESLRRRPPLPHKSPLFQHQNLPCPNKPKNT